MNAVEIFRFFQNKGYSRLDSPQTRKGPLPKRRNKEDAELALELMACIAAVDEGVFPSINHIKFRFMAGKGREDDVAAYCWPSEKSRESYDVFVQGLEEKILDETQHRRLILIDQEGRMDYSCDMALEQYSIGVAVHEVRHRLQKQEKGFRIFSKENLARADGQLKHFIRFTEIIFKTRLECLKDQGKPIVARRFSPIEFDAQLIEFLAHDLVCRGASPKAILELVRLQPPLEGLLINPFFTVDFSSVLG